jgi:hypothetical protein
MTRCSMTIRILAACIITVLPIVVPTAQAKQCSIARPLDPQGHWWSWRLIDGRKCWYEGRTVISKSALQWSSPATPITVLTDKPNNPLVSRASLPDAAESFESLWRARAINR